MKVLVVDDHALFREGLALLLAPLADPLVVTSVGSCEEAFAALETQRDIDLVLMDLGLPGLPGIGGIAAIKERFPMIPVVVLSSADDKGTVLEALDAGAMGFIPKSSNANVMVGALKLILAKGVYLPPSVFLGAEGLLGRRSEPPPGGAADPSALRPVDLGLTARQAEVLYLILQGKPAKLICRELALSASTVKVHTSAVLRALNVTTRTQAIVAAGRMRLTFAEPIDSSHAPSVRAPAASTQKL
jgi:DNA-binding NarL/FixJ family response regulator